MAPADRSPSGRIAAEQAYCPACDLKHVRQPDWLCPRCGMPVETEAWRSAVRARAAEPEPEARPGFPLGSLVAGAVLALTSMVLAIGLARHPVAEHRWPLVAALVLLLVLGLELIFKVSPARWVVMALSLVALLALAEHLLRARLPDLWGDPLPPAARAALRGVIGALSPLRAAFVGGLLGGVLLLVPGRPGRWRIVAGALLAAPLAVAELVRWLVP